jgi:Ulp1 family protease
LDERKESESDSQVFFNTQFFTSLSELGVQYVMDWTLKWNIETFSKRFLFLPIVKAFHWSLCVICNAGKVTNSDKDVEEDDDVEVLSSFSWFL